MAKLGIINDAFLFIQDDLISDFGLMNEYPAAYQISENNFDVIDATGKMVFPSFCDPHTHLVYAGSREQEFTDKIRIVIRREVAAGEEAYEFCSKARYLKMTHEQSWSDREIISQGTGCRNKRILSTGS